MTEQQRQQAFVEWLRQGEERFGATVRITQPITQLPNGGFAYTPPALEVALIEHWQPPTDESEKK
jgi:hypothetical protein